MNWEQVQIIRSEFRNQSSVIGKTDQTGKGKFSLFTLRGDSWHKCPIKYKKLKLWKIDLNWRGEWKEREMKIQKVKYYDIMDDTSMTQ